MTMPISPVVFAAAMDPSDRIDYRLDLAGMLVAGEAIASATPVVMAESALLGFQLEPSGGYAPSQPTATSLVFWCSVKAINQSDATWSGNGQDCGIEINVVTNSTPPRSLQRTVIIKVQQQ